jgi:hypothetical protein
MRRSKACVLVPALQSNRSIRHDHTSLETSQTGDIYSGSVRWCDDDAVHDCDVAVCDCAGVVVDTAFDSR